MPCLPTLVGIQANSVHFFGLSTFEIFRFVGDIVTLPRTINSRYFLVLYPTLRY